MGSPQGSVECPANLLVSVAVLPEYVPKEHQICMKALLIMQSYRKYGMHVEFLVMRAIVQVEVGVGRFTAHFMVQRAIMSPVNICQGRDDGYVFPSPW
jgi:hypothetical protein